MNSSEIERRKPVWLAISEFYLDTELGMDDAIRIEEIFRNSRYSLNELKNIDFYEVRPIVGMNLWSTAGEWAGFDKDWLWDQIQTRSINKARKSNIFTKWKRRQFESNRFSYWNKFRTEFQDLLETEYPITLNTTGKLFNYVLCDNSEWEDFLRYSEKIRTQLNTNFAEKIDDLDSKYWDFHFNNKVFTLHFNSMVGDVKLLTDRSNGTTEFQELLKQLGEK